MPDVNLAPQNLFPTKGLNVRLDYTHIGLDTTYSSENVHFGKGTMAVRFGTDRPSDITYSSPYGFGVTGTALYYAHYSNPYLAVRNRWFCTAGGSLYVYVNNTWTAYQSVPNEYGTFLQYRDRVFYASPNQKPLMLVETSPSGNTMACLPAGIDGPAQVKILESCEDANIWSVSGTGGFIFRDSMSSRYVEGNSGIALIGTSPSVTLTFTLTKQMSLVFDDNTTPDAEDCIAFYLYRFKKARWKYGRLYLFTNQQQTTYVSVELFGSAINYGNRYSHNKTPTFTILDEWDRDINDYKLFLVKIRFRDLYMPLTGNTIYGMQFILGTDSYTSPTDPAAMTIDMIHLRKGPPAARTISQMVYPGSSYAYYSQGWSAQPTNGVAFNSDTSIRNHNCTSLLDTATPAEVVVSKTFSSPYLNLYTFKDGTTLKPRDRLYLYLSVHNALSGHIYIRFTDSSDRTATYYFYAVKTSYNPAPRRQSVPLGLGIFSDYGFYNFTWSAVKEIRIVKPTGQWEQRIDVEDICIEQAVNVKMVHLFEAVDVRAVDAVGEGAELFLSEFPRLQRIADRAGEIYTRLKYHTNGNGYLTYPDTEYFERGFSTASMRLTATGESANVSLKDSGGNIVEELGGLLKDQNAEYLDGGSGFKVQFALPAATRLLDGGCLDLSVYKKYKRKWFSWFDPDDETEVTAAIDDNDRFRIWIHVDQPQNLARIIFRLYYAVNPAEEQRDGWFTFSSIDKDNNYFEYVFDALALRDRKTEELLSTFGYGAGKDERVTFNIPGVGTYSVNPGDALAFLTGDDKYKSVQYDKKTGLSTILTWKRGDMLNYSDNEASQGYWSRIKGIGLIVVPMPGKQVSVSFDNWRIQSADNPAGTYYYKTTFVDLFGSETAASDASQPVTAQNKKVFLSYIPKPPQTSYSPFIARKIYRMGGTSDEYRLVTVITDNAQTEWLDNKADQELGEVLGPDTYAPPRCAVMAQVAHQVWYGNITDRFNKSYPSRIVRSLPYNPCRVPDESAIDIRPDDGAGITAIVVWKGYPVVFKQTSIWTIDMQTSELVLRHDGDGCIAPRTIGCTNDGIIFLSHRGVLMTDLSNVVEIGAAINPGIVRVIPVSEDPQYDLVSSCAGIFDNGYVLVIGESLVYRYDFTAQAWEMHSFLGHKVGDLESDLRIRALLPIIRYDGDRVIPCLAALGDCTYNTLTYSRVLYLFSGYTDSSLVDTNVHIPIAFKYSTGHSDLSVPYEEKRLQKLFVRLRKLSNRSGYTPSCQIAAYHDTQLSDTIVTLTPTTSSYSTERIVCPQYITGYSQGIYISGQNRLEISQLVPSYIVLPMR